LRAPENRWRSSFGDGPEKKIVVRGVGEQISDRAKVRARSLLGFRAGDKAHEKVMPINPKKKREGR
jgi:hypothetical protein